MVQRTRNGRLEGQDPYSSSMRALGARSRSRIIEFLGSTEENWGLEDMARKTECCYYFTKLPEGGRGEGASQQRQQDSWLTLKENNQAKREG